MSDETNLKDILLALNGKCILTQKLKMNTNYKVEVDIIITHSGASTLKNADFYNWQIKADLDGTAKVIDNNGEVIYAETTKSQSKLLRNQIFHLGRDYEDDMRILRHLYDTVIVDAIDKHKRGENV